MDNSINCSLPLKFHFIHPSECKLTAETVQINDDPLKNTRTAVARFQRPTVLLTGRNRSESPSLSRFKALDHPSPIPSSDRYDFECLQRELEKKSGTIQANMDDFVNLGCLGAGTCSVVYKMQHKGFSDLILAVKHMRRSSHCHEENKRIMMDLNVVTKSCDCPHIVKCMGIFFTTGDVWICMEVMSTCLDKLLKSLGRPFPEKVIGKITVAIIKALEYLKTVHKVMHRDVKPSNMLLSSYGEIKLCDFGISGKLKDSIARSRQLGCIGYMAPERLDTPTYDVRADIWSLGISLVELATGSFPYKGTEVEFAIMSKIISDPPPSLPQDMLFTTAFRQFVELCLLKNQAQRPKYRALMTMSFYEQHNVEPHSVAEWYKSICGGGLFNSLFSSLISTSGCTDNISQSAIVSFSSNYETGTVPTTASSPASTVTLSPDISDRVFPDQCILKLNSTKDEDVADEVDKPLNVIDKMSSETLPLFSTSKQHKQILAVNKQTNDIRITSPSQIQTSINCNLLIGDIVSQCETGDQTTRSQASSGYGSAGSDSSPGSLNNQIQLANHFKMPCECLTSRPLVLPLSQLAQTAQNTRLSLLCRDSGLVSCDSLYDDASKRSTIDSTITSDSVLLPTVHNTLQPKMSDSTHHLAFGIRSLARDSETKCLPISYKAAPVQLNNTRQLQATETRIIQNQQSTNMLCKQNRMQCHSGRHLSTQANTDNSNQLIDSSKIAHMPYTTEMTVAQKGHTSRTPNSIIPVSVNLNFHIPPTVNTRSTSTGRLLTRLPQHNFVYHNQQTTNQPSTKFSENSSLAHFKSVTQLSKPGSLVCPNASLQQSSNSNLEQNSCSINMDQQEYHHHYYYYYHHSPDKSNTNSLREISSGPSYLSNNSLPSLLEHSSLHVSACNANPSKKTSAVRPVGYIASIAAKPLLTGQSDRVNQSACQSSPLFGPRIKDSRTGCSTVSSAASSVQTILNRTGLGSCLHGNRHQSRLFLPKLSQPSQPLLRTKLPLASSATSEPSEITGLIYSSGHVISCLTGTDCVEDKEYRSLSQPPRLRNASLVFEANV